MPKLLPVADSLDVIPEPYRDRYEERDGKFVLAKEIEIEDVNGLKSALERERREAKGAKEKLKDFEGIDPHEFKTWKEQQAEREREAAEKKGEWEKLRNQLLDTHKQELGKRESAITELNGVIFKLMAERQADEAIREAGSDAIKALRPHVLSQLRVVKDEESGEYVVQVVDAKGKPRFSKKTGEPMTPKEVALELSEDPQFMPLFKGSGVSGAGVNGKDGVGGNGAGGGGKRKITQAQFRDRATYLALAEEAKKQGKSVMDIVMITD